MRAIIWCVAAAVLTCEGFRPIGHKAPRLSLGLGASARETFAGETSIGNDENETGDLESLMAGAADESEDKIELPRLYADLGSMVRWIERSEGFVDATVREAREGWTLHANRVIPEGTTLLSIPKALCLYSDPEFMAENALFANTVSLMNSLDKKHWRARLAIALLSERVRPSSFFRSYLRNLPFEFWGLPVFFSSDEFAALQDTSLMQKTRDRCRFLTEFAEGVLLPLQRNIKDPFSGNSADVNAFGWGFASASSRAFRGLSFVGDTGGAVMIPGIDIASHSISPNCAVVDVGSSFALVTTSLVSLGDELTISYGDMSNEELFSDYGFSVDQNPHEKINLKCDPALVNAARAVMGVGSYSRSKIASSDTSIELLPIQFANAAVAHLLEQGNNLNAASSFTLRATTNTPKITVGREDRWSDRSLHGWQLQWLRVLRLHGPGADFGMTLGCSSPAQIDGRLWAALRILHAGSEEELTRHGYDPFLLQSSGSMLAPGPEAMVVKTLVGIIVLVLRSMGSDLEADLAQLQTASGEAIGSAGGSARAIEEGDWSSVSLGSGGDIGLPEELLTEAQRFLRKIFGAPLPQTLSPTVRRLQSMQAIQAAATRASTKSAAVVYDDIALAEEEPPKQFGGGKALAATSGYSVPERGANVSALGQDLPANLREALRFRARRKQALIDLALSLGELYKKLQNADNSIEELLPVPLDDKLERRARIRSFMDEVRSQQPGGKESDVLEQATLISNRWSRGEGFL